MRWILLGLLLCTLSCAEIAPRHTTEILVDEDDMPTMLVVEWPKGVKASDIVTSDQTSNGETRAMSAAPMPGGTP